MSWSRRDLCMSAFALALAPTLARAEGGTVLILQSDIAPRSQSLVKAFKRDISGAVIMTYDLSAEADAGAFVADQLRGLPVSLILALGDKATLAAQREFATTPIIFADVSDAIPINSRPGLEQVSSRVDPAAALARLRVVLPTLAKVGLLRGPNCADIVEATAAACRAAGLEPLVRAANGPNDLPSAVTALFAGADATWLLADAVLWTPTAVSKALHQAQVEARVVVGFSRAHLQGANPAPLSLVSDPDGIGAAAAARARQVLSGQAAGAIAYAAPVLLGNASALRNAKVPLPKKVVEGLDELLR